MHSDDESDFGIDRVRSFAFVTTRLLPRLSLSKLVASSAYHGGKMGRGRGMVQALMPHLELVDEYGICEAGGGGFYA